MRTPILLLCLALAGCAGADAGSQFALSTEPAASAAPASSAAGHNALAQATAQKKKGAKKDEQSEDWWKEGGVTREKINAMCWMKYESGRKDMPVDKRADLVNDCVVKTLKEHPVE